MTGLESTFMTDLSHLGIHGYDKRAPLEEASEPRAKCDWRGCPENAWFAREMSVKPPGFKHLVDITVRLCPAHHRVVSEPCGRCQTVGMWRGRRCEVCEGVGWVARPGSVLKIDWSLVLQGLGEKLT